MTTKEIRCEWQSGQEDRAQQMQSTLKRTRHEIIEKLLLLKNSTLDEQSLFNYISELEAKFHRQCVSVDQTS